MLEQEVSHLSVATFAGVIGKSERTVQRYIRKGRIRTIEVCGVPRIPQSELAHFSAPSILGSYAGFGAIGADSVKPHDELSSGDLPLSSLADTMTTDEQKTAAINVAEVEEPMVSSTHDDTIASVVIPVSAVSTDDDEFDDNMSPSNRRATPLMTTDFMQQGFVPIDRHETAVMRLGWLEAQLDMTRKMLGDGGAREKEMHDRETQLQQQLAVEAEARRLAELRALEAETRLAAVQLEQERKKVSWFQRVFMREG